MSFQKNSPYRRGFSLIEVVLAIGIFMVTVLALVGLLGPALKSVDEVQQTDAIALVVVVSTPSNQRSPEILLMLPSLTPSLMRSPITDTPPSSSFGTA